MAGKKTTKGNSESTAASRKEKAKTTSKKKVSSGLKRSDAPRTTVIKTAKGKTKAVAARKPLFFDTSNERPLCVVGIGASGGGLEAIGDFLSHMPSDSGVAFVLVSHLDPTHSSIMADLLKKYTGMEVSQADNGVKVRSNRLYVIPPGKDMAIMNGSLQLFKPRKERGMRHPIDFFFRSLAKDQRERAACIVMSGAGTDGTLGLKDIKGEGGMVMVQEPSTAKYDGMPRSAVDTGFADFVLPPEKMPGQLLDYVRHPYIIASEKRDDLMRKISDQLEKVMLLIRNQTGHDFSYYKENTVIRRIERRMNINQIDNVSDYVNFLQSNSVEVELLFKELLIGVTSFFRDMDAFEVLKEKVLPQLFKGRVHGRSLRVWVPGCSTGEEAYSLAIIIREYMEQNKKSFGVQMFATDIDSRAIEKSRAGIYPDSIASDVSPELLKKYFSKGDNTYQIKKGIREMVVFAVQNAIKDPPFTRLDLVSCRNLLIYLSPRIQKKVLPIFQFVLNPDGFLFLGSSESIGETVDLFSVVDRKWKIFKRKRGPRVRPDHLEFPALHPMVKDITESQRTGVESRSHAFLQLGEVARKVIMEDYAPPCVVINEKNKIIFFHGKTGKYLEPAPGEARLDIVDMAREGLEYELGKTVRQAVTGNKRAISEGIRVRHNGFFLTVDIEVRPITQPEQFRGLYLVVFKERPMPERPVHKAGRQKKGEPGRVLKLEKELVQTKEYLRHLIEKQETTNEELQSTNEELQASNEELQSTNEELETSKEEIQSVNEELITVNSELQKKIDELSSANNDLNNLLAGTNIAVIFLDTDLCIKRFTPAATQVVNLIQSDIGRPISQITTNLEGDHLHSDVEEVLSTLVFKEKEVRTKNGEWFMIRIMPYRTTENVIDGAVVTFFDMTSVKYAREYAESIVNTVREPLLVLDRDLRVISANDSFYRTFDAGREETENKLVYELGDNQWNIPELKKLLEEILPESSEFSDFSVEHRFPKIGCRKMLLNARRVYEADRQTERILLAIEDITERDHAEGVGKDPGLAGGK